MIIRKNIFILIVCLFASIPASSRAQPLSIERTSVEYQIANSEGVYIGKLKKFDVAAGQAVTTVFCDVTEVLKGKSRDIVSAEVESWKVEDTKSFVLGCACLISIDNDEDNSGTTVQPIGDTKRDDYITSSFRVLKSEEEIVSFVRECVRRYPGGGTMQGTFVTVPSHALQIADSELLKHCKTGGYVRLLVPVEHSLEVWAQTVLRIGPLKTAFLSDLQTYRDAIDALKYFPTSENIDLIKTVAKHDADFTANCEMTMAYWGL